MTDEACRTGEPPTKWKPCASKTTDDVVKYWERKIRMEKDDRLDRQDVTNGGQNNFWAATSQLGAAWKKSGNKWKWRCKLSDNVDLKGFESQVDHLKDRKEQDLEEVRTAFASHHPDDFARQDNDDAKLAPLEVVREEESISKRSKAGDADLEPVPVKKPKFSFGIRSSSEKDLPPCHSDRPQYSAGPFSKAGILPRFGLPNGGESHKPAQKSYTPNPGQGTSEEKAEGTTLVFKTAGQQLAANYLHRYGGPSAQVSSASYGSSTKTLGASRPAAVQNAFKPPLLPSNNVAVSSSSSSSSVTPDINQGSSCDVTDERLKNVDPKMVELVKNEIMDCGSSLHWDDIAGLDFVKGIIKEIVVFPMLRPDLFKGLRAPPKGLLLFGPPGTGKTLIGKCIASQSKSTFFSISASSLTSKWVGDGEKMVRALFAVARVHQPAVVFIDEIDSLLSARSDTEHESSRRLKTEFLVQLDGASTDGEERILIVGATNRPQDLDEAARRRLVKRLYVPLPEAEAREQIITNLMQTEKNSLTPADKARIVALTDGYSGADMANLCRDAAVGPIRNLDYSRIESISDADIRPICLQDFHNALRQVKASVSDQDLSMYLDWDRRYGSGK